MILKNNKGTILLVSVTAMVIMMIIGFVCLQMYINQNIFDTLDATNKRTYYAAEGAIEIMRGYIDKHIPDNDNALGGKGYIASVAQKNNSGIIDATNKGWCPSEIMTFLSDNDVHPHITVEVYLRRLTLQTATHVKNLIDSNLLPIDFSNACNDSDIPSNNRAYEIIAKATASYKSVLISKNIITTVHCYFYTKYDVENEGTPSEKIKHKPKIVIWRVD